MNKRQKAILLRFAIIVVITVAAIIAMINFKDWVNRTEAMRGIEHLGRLVLEYRESHGSLPSESYLDEVKKGLEGHVRLGQIYYRALWIEPDATPDEILAYTQKDYNSFFFHKGFIVLRLDGGVEWMEPEDFKNLLNQQQTPMEIDTLRK